LRSVTTLVGHNYCVPVFYRLCLSRFYSTHEILTEDKIYEYHYQKINTACKNKKLDIAIEIFYEMIAKGIKPKPQLYRPILNCFIKQNQEKKLYQFIEDMEKNFGIKNNIIHMTAKINELCHSKKIKEAIRVFHSLPQLGLKPDSLTFLPIISALAKTKELELAQQWYYDMKYKYNIEPFQYHTTALLRAYVVTDKLEQARLFFDSIQDKTLAIYNVMIDAYMRNIKTGKKHVRLALDLLSELEEKGLKPSVYTYSTIMNGLAESTYIHLAEEFFEKMLKRGIEPDIVCYNILGKVYCLSNDVDRAILLLYKLGPKANQETYSTIIVALLEKGEFDRAMQFFQEVLSKNMVPSVFMLNCIIKEYYKKGKIKQAQELVLEMYSKYQVKPDDNTCNLVLAGILQQDIEEGLKFFDKLNRDLRYYITVIKYLCAAKKPDLAKQYLDHMVGCAIHPKQSCFYFIIQSYFDEKKYAQAEKLFREMSRKYNVAPGPGINNLILTELIKYGKPERAREFFDEIIERNSYSYEIIMKCFSDNTDFILLLNNRLQTENYYVTPTMRDIINAAKLQKMKQN
jgi:pentatricopeptide repeat protein